MKRKQLLITLSLALTLLFSIVFQSIHSYEHLSKQFSEKICHHAKNSDSEITHQHHNFDRCLVCEFTTGHYISSLHFSYQLNTQQTETPCFFVELETPVSFSGSSYLLRGPPMGRV